MRQKQDKVTKYLINNMSFINYERIKISFLNIGSKWPLHFKIEVLVHLKTLYLYDTF